LDEQPWEVHQPIHPEESVTEPVDTYARLETAAGVVLGLSSARPRVAIVLGSGLGTLVESAQVETSIAYAEIPFMPASTAPGHAGTLFLGTLEDRPVAMLSGRAHMYEGYAPDQVVFAVRLMRRLGAETLIVTNAAGGVNTDFSPGQLMLISDHINLTGRNPLVGPPDPRIGVRFPDMSAAYDQELRALARASAGEVGLPLVEGVYLGLLGPNYETPAEVRMARILGADAVGMSTVLEVIAARHMGMRVLGISCITNMAAGILPQTLSEEEVIDTALRVRDDFASLVRRIVAAYPTETSIN
jgi:purine-nucleoside phosphorylase